MQGAQQPPQVVHSPPATLAPTSGTTGNTAAQGGPEVRAAPFGGRAASPAATTLPLPDFDRGKTQWGGRQFERLYTEVVVPLVRETEKTSVPQLRERLQQLQTASLSARSGDACEAKKRYSHAANEIRDASSPPKYRIVASCSAASPFSCASADTGVGLALEEEQEAVKIELDRLDRFEVFSFQRLQRFREAFVNVLAVPERQGTVKAAQLQAFAKQTYPGWEQLCSDIDQFSQLHNLDQFVCFSLAFDAVQILQETCGDSGTNRDAKVIWDPQLILGALHREQHFQLLCLVELATNLYPEDSLGVYGNLELQSSRVAVKIFADLGRYGFVEKLLERIGLLISTIVCPPVILPTTTGASTGLGASDSAPAGLTTANPCSAGLLSCAFPSTYASLLGPFTTGSAGANAVAAELLRGGSDQVAGAARALTALSEVHHIALLDTCVKILHLYFSRFQASFQEVEALIALIPHVVAPNCAPHSSAARCSLGAQELDAKLQQAAAASAEPRGPGSLRGVEGPSSSSSSGEACGARTSGSCPRSLSARLTEVLMLALHPRLLRWSVVKKGPGEEEGRQRWCDGKEVASGAAREKERQDAVDLDDLPLLTELNPMSSPQDIEDWLRDYEEEHRGTSGVDSLEHRGGTSGSLLRQADAGQFYDKLVKLHHGVFLAGRSAVDAVDLVSFQLLHELLWMAFVGNSDERSTCLLKRLVDVEVRRARVADWVGGGFEDDDSGLSLTSRVLHQGSLLLTCNASSLGANCLTTATGVEDGWRGRLAAGEMSDSGALLADRRGERHATVSGYAGNPRGSGVGWLTNICRQSFSRKDEGTSSSLNLLFLLRLIGSVCRAYPAASVHYADLLAYCADRFAFLAGNENEFSGSRETAYGDDLSERGSVCRLYDPADVVPPSAWVSGKTRFQGAESAVSGAAAVGRLPEAFPPGSAASGSVAAAVTTCSGKMQALHAAARAIGVSAVVHPPLLVGILDLAAILASRGGPVVAQRVAASFGASVRPPIQFARLFLTLYSQLEAAIRGQYAALPQYAFAANSGLFINSEVSNAPTRCPGGPGNAISSLSLLGSGRAVTLNDEHTAPGQHLSFRNSSSSVGGAAGALGRTERPPSVFTPSAGALAPSSDGVSKVLDASGSYPRGMLAALESCLRLAAGVSSTFLLSALPPPFPGLPERLSYSGWPFAGRPAALSDSFMSFSSQSHAPVADSSGSPGLHLLDLVYAILHMTSNSQHVKLTAIKAACLEVLTGNLVRNPATAMSVLVQLGVLTDTLRRDLHLSSSTLNKNKWPPLSPLSLGGDEGRLLLAFATCVAYNLQLVGLRRRFDSSLGVFGSRLAIDYSGSLSGSACQEQTEPPLSGSGGAQEARASADQSESRTRRASVEFTGSFFRRGHTKTIGSPRSAEAATAASAKESSQNQAADIAHLVHLIEFLLETFVTVFGRPFEEAWKAIPEARYWRLAAVLLRSFRSIMRGPLPRIGAVSVDRAVREPYSSREEADATATTYLLRAFLCLESDAFDTLMKITCFPNASTLYGFDSPDSAVSLAADAVDTPAPFGVASPSGVGGEQQKYFCGIARGNWNGINTGGSCPSGWRTGQRRRDWEPQTYAAVLSATCTSVRRFFAEQVGAVGLDILRILFQRDVLFLQLCRRHATNRLRKSWAATRNKWPVRALAECAASGVSDERMDGRSSSPEHSICPSTAREVPASKQAAIGGPRADAQAPESAAADCLRLRFAHEQLARSASPLVSELLAAASRARKRTPENPMEPRLPSLSFLSIPPFSWFVLAHLGLGSACTTTIKKLVLFTLHQLNLRDPQSLSAVFFTFPGIMESTREAVACALLTSSSAGPERGTPAFYDRLLLPEGEDDALVHCTSSEEPGGSLENDRGGYLISGRQASECDNFIVPGSAGSSGAGAAIDVAEPSLEDLSDPLFSSSLGSFFLEHPSARQRARLDSALAAQKLREHAAIECEAPFLSALRLSSGGMQQQGLQRGNNARGAGLRDGGQSERILTGVLSSVVASACSSRNVGRTTPSHLPSAPITLVDPAGSNAAAVATAAALLAEGRGRARVVGNESERAWRKLFESPARHLFYGEVKEVDEFEKPGNYLGAASCFTGLPIRRSLDSRWQRVEDAVTESTDVAAWHALRFQECTELEMVAPATGQKGEESFLLGRRIRGAQRLVCGGETGAEFLSGDVVSGALQPSARPLALSTKWFMGAHLADTEPKAAWVLPPYQPPGNPPFAYDRVPACYHGSTFHTTSLRRLALLLLHTGVTRTCKVTDVPRSIAVGMAKNQHPLFSCYAAETGVQHHPNGGISSTPISLSLLGLSAASGERIRFGWSAAALAAAECPEAPGLPATARTCPAAWVESTGGDIAHFAFRRQLPLLSWEGGVSQLRSSLLGTSSEGDHPAKVAEALMALLQEAPPFQLLDDNVGDREPHPVDTSTGRFLHACERHSLFLCDYEHQWEVLKCLQILQSLISAPSTRPAALELLALCWPGRYQFLERLTALRELGEMPVITRPLFLLQLSALADVCATELRETARSGSFLAMPKLPPARVVVSTTGSQRIPAGPGMAGQWSSGKGVPSVNSEAVSSRPVTTGNRVERCYGPSREEEVVFRADMVDQLVKVADLLMDTSRQGGDRDVPACFRNLLFFFRRSTRAPDLLRALAQTTGKKAKRCTRRIGEEQRMWRQLGQVGDAEGGQWMMRIERASQLLFELCETDWNVSIPSSLNMSGASEHGFVERATSLLDPLVFLKLRDQILGPLLAVNAYSHGPIEPLGIAGDGVFPRHCGGSFASANESADCSDSAGWEKSADLLASLLATLWIQLFRVNLARYTAIALHSALGALVPLCQACYGLLSPVFAASGGPGSSWFPSRCPVPSSAISSVFASFFGDGHRLQVAQRSLETLERFLSPSLCEEFDLPRIFGLVLLFRLSLGVWCTDAVIVRLAVAAQSARSESGGLSNVCSPPVFPSAFPSHLAHLIVQLLLRLSQKDSRQKQPEGAGFSAEHLESKEPGWAIRSLLYDCLVLLFGLPVFAVRMSSLDRLTDNSLGNSPGEKEGTKLFTCVTEDEYFSANCRTLSGVAVALLASLRKDSAAKSELFSILFRDARRSLARPDTADRGGSRRLNVHGEAAGRGQCGLAGDVARARSVTAGPYGLVLGSLRVLNFLLEGLVPTQLLYEGLTCSGVRETGKRGVIGSAERTVRDVFWSTSPYVGVSESLQILRGVGAGAQRKQGHWENDARWGNETQSMTGEEPNTARKGAFSEVAGVVQSEEEVEDFGDLHTPSEAEVLAAIVLARLYADSDSEAVMRDAAYATVGHDCGARTQEKETVTNPLSSSAVMGLALSERGVPREARKEELVLATISLIRTACLHPHFVREFLFRPLSCPILSCSSRSAAFYGRSRTPPRLFELFLSGTALQESLKVVSLATFLRPVELPDDIAQSVVKVAPVELVLSFLSVLQTLLSLNPVPAVVVDRTVQWVNNHEAFFLFPLRIVALLATSWSRQTRRFSSSFSHLCREWNSAVRLTRSVEVEAKTGRALSCASRSLRGWTEESILRSALDGFCGTFTASGLLEGKKGDCMHGETVDRLYLATAAVLRVYRQILSAGRNRRKTVKRGLSHQLLRINIVLADTVEAMIADLLLFLVSDFAEEGGEGEGEEEKNGSVRGVGTSRPRENKTARDFDLQEGECLGSPEQPLFSSLKDTEGTRMGKMTSGKIVRLSQQLKPRDERLKWDIVLLCLEILGFSFGYFSVEFVEHQRAGNALEDADCTAAVERFGTFFKTSVELAVKAVTFLLPDPEPRKARMTESILSVFLSAVEASLFVLHSALLPVLRAVANGNLTGPSDFPPLA
ncbi:hypothetical protein CSUI_002214, partial [Cystoisospora suis]